jgi:tetratricopeptide (TPR) repeat protein
VNGRAEGRAPRPSRRDEVARAAALAGEGRFVEALRLVLAAQQARPAADYLRRLDRWLSAPGAMEALDVSGFAAACSRCQEPDVARKLLPVLEKVRAARGPHELLTVVAARTARIAGEVARAVAIAQEDHARAPSRHTAGALGTALHAQGKLKRALDAFREGLQSDEGDLPLYLEIGDTALALERWAEAAAAYKAVTRIEPRHPWATPSLAYARARGTGTRKHTERLERLARKSREQSRARLLYDELAPYALRIAPPPSSLLKAASKYLREPAVRPAKSIVVASLEPPSAVSAYRAVLASLGVSEARVGFAEIPRPDPRLPSARVKHRLWSYAAPAFFGLFTKLGTEARPALPPADAAVSRRVGKLAASTYDAAAWCARGKRDAAALPDEAVRSLLAVMVHPPRPPKGFAQDAWVFRVQVASAMMLCWAEGGLEAPGAAAAFDSLLAGPIDWTTTAAIIALAELARVERRLSKIVQAKLGPLAREPFAPIHLHCVVAPAVSCLLRIPDLPRSSREEIEALRAELDG